MHFSFLNIDFKQNQTKYIKNLQFQIGFKHIKTGNKTDVVLLPVIISVSFKWNGRPDRA